MAFHVNCLSEKIRLGISCVKGKIRLDISFELSAKQTIHMKCQVLFSLKDNSHELPSLTFSENK